MEISPVDSSQQKIASKKTLCFLNRSAWGGFGVTAQVKDDQNNSEAVWNTIFT